MWFLLNCVSLLKNWKQKKNIVYVIFYRNKVLKCSNCNYVYYCNRTCQKEAWPSHKNECAFLKKTLPRIVPDAARILAKIIIKLKNGGDLEKSFYTETCFRKFKDLMSRKFIHQHFWFRCHKNMFQSILEDL